MSGGDLIGLVLVVGVVGGFGALVFLLVRGTRDRLTTFAASVAAQFGITAIRTEGLTTVLELTRPRWSGVLRAHGRPRSAVEILHFTGTASTPKSAWSLTSKRMSPPEGPGARVSLESRRLRDRYVVFAERPDELRGFFDDPDVEKWLILLDAGAAHALVGALPGVAISVQGTEISVMVSGQQGEDVEHLRMALLLIERVGEWG